MDELIIILPFRCHIDEVFISALIRSALLPLRLLRLNITFCLLRLPSECLKMNKKYRLLRWDYQ